MKNIGGETELNYTNLNEYLTDSARSSLRLILKNLKNKKFIIPNFTCAIVIAILDENNVKYDFYEIDKKLNINQKKIKNKEYDVFYLINFFGKYQKINNKFFNNKIVIEDNVFLPFFENSRKLKNWIGFNSLRKVTPLADGSLIKSTLILKDYYILKKQANFVKYKYKGKKLKYDYLNKKKRLTEKDYLSYFEKGEKTLNKQKEIFGISNLSLFKYFDFVLNIDSELQIRKNNYQILANKLKLYSIKFNPVFPSFFTILVKNRDKLKFFLKTKKIFLPIHWPQIKNVESILYKHIISIPVDSRYGEKDMLRISNLINYFYTKNITIKNEKHNK